MTVRSFSEMPADIEAYEAAHPWRTGFWKVWRGVIHTPRHTWREIHWAWQRVFRGWDDHSLWTLDTWICSTVGAQLQALANTTHGYPISSPAQEWTPGIWAGTLLLHGKALAEYAEFKFSLGTPEHSDRAATALRWVADNLGDLWD